MPGARLTIKPDAESGAVGQGKGSVHGVDTRGGVVTLNGLAGDEPARQRAEKMAGSVKGVREVRNFLVVKRA